MTERRYGRWAAEPEGKPEMGNRCIVEVKPPGAWNSKQCSRLRGNGPEKLYCKQHAKKLVEIEQEGILLEEVNIPQRPDSTD
jgi:hypothetical protein